MDASGNSTRQPDPGPGTGNAFAVELRRWRDLRSLSRTALAKQMGYDRSYVSKIESGSEPPTREFATHAETALRAGGALRQAFREYIATRPSAKDRRPLPEPASPSPDHIGGLVVDHDDATLTYDNGSYCLTQRRRVINIGTEPVTRYLIRISVDRYPSDPERSNLHYSRSPLTWDEINLHAWHSDAHITEPMHWAVHHDRDAVKEVWLLFANETGRFPLYPGETCWIRYEYTVSDQHWGNWFQRAVRLPTNRLSVRLDFPTSLEPTVWGLYTSMTADAMPLPTAVSQTTEDDRKIYHWATNNPPLHARYRLEWDFRNPPQTSTNQPAPRPADIMRSLGIVQDDDPRLRAPARPFDLPDEADDARRVIAELHAAAQRVARVHTFGKGMGIAAPQIGIDRAAAIIQPAGSDDTINLLNPRIIEASPETDEHYEGCLSFFDVRGLTPRPLTIHVEHQDTTGTKRITVYQRGTARLIAHEIDHLRGTLYTDHMPPGRHPIPIEQYHGTGTTWHY